MSVGLLATVSCAEQSPRRVDAVEMDRIKNERDECFARNTRLLDDGTSDAKTVGEAVSAACRSFTINLIRAGQFTDQRYAQLLLNDADQQATQFVLVCISRMACLHPRNAPDFARPEYGFHLRDDAEWNTLHRAAGFAEVSSQINRF